MRILSMGELITCVHCSIEIIEYFRERYYGNIGKYSKTCGVDFH
jgi:hypothetical protein